MRCPWLTGTCCAVAMGLISAGGCVPPRPTGYFGPTLSLPAAVDKINANNHAVPTLWAHIDYFEATILDDKQKSHFVNGDGVLLYRKPNELLLRANKEMIGRIFEVGSTADRYWLTLVPEADTQWWGTHAGSANIDPGRVPIPPQSLIEVLALGEFDANLNQPPVPVMRFNNDERVYMVVWNSPGPNHWYAQKEVWYDLDHLWPVKVLLFDRNGRVVVRANLLGHEPVEVPGRPRDQWPVVAREYKLFFPDAHANLSFKLSNVVLQKNGAPREGTIRFPVEPGVSRKIQIDAESPQ